MASVGRAWAILKGRLSGNKEEAHAFLNQMPKQEYLERNRTESRTRGKIRKRRRQMGQFRRRA
jgi:hypothetical protein